MDKIIPLYLKQPVCAVDKDGKICETNAAISEVFEYGEIEGADIFVLTGFRAEELREGEKVFKLSRNERVFRIDVSPAQEMLILLFEDITELEKLKLEYDAEKLCVCIVNVDNYDEILNQTSDENMSVFASAVDRTLRSWGSKLSASVTRYREGRYLFVFERRAYERVAAGNFAIMDEIRTIETEADFPVTLSMGVGLDGETPSQTDEWAEDALELALGRGGDQVAVKSSEGIEYYGGKAMTVEKSNKGKSRIVGHALLQLFDQAENVMIMGHKNPDMDAFGAALGVYRLAESAGKDCHIVINNYNETLAEIFLQAKESEKYSFINHEKALSLVTKDSLIVVVDTHRPSICECPELLEAAEKVAVIDHHRRAEEYIENPVLTYIEPYASSTCELVTEILQYVGKKKSVQKLEAEAMLAGIAIDTNRFSIKTGVRTFDAAAWLRRNGADTTTVKRFFQNDALSFKIKAECIANAEIYEGMAFSAATMPHPNIQILNSQAADELLEIKGVKASFVAGRDPDGNTVVSARSLGDINVQLIMEKFGGGGHLTTAGAQPDMSPEEVLAGIKAMFTEEE